MGSNYKIPILTYHSIMDDDKQSLSIQSFKKQMLLMKKMGYQTIKFNELDNDNNKKKFIITFDDGYENIFLNALPILKQLNFTAICFFVVSKIGHYNEWDVDKLNYKMLRLMNFEQINEWLLSGFDVGSHTMDHFNLKKLNYEEKIKQIIKPKKIFNDKFNIEINSFSYPFGSYDIESRNMVKENYDFAVSTKRSRYFKNKFDNELLPRVPINRKESLLKFFLKIKTPYEDLKFRK
jgi:peptidoglycan/xylan/chitin deacetylase (PgdA/CDA1 family)